MPSGDPATAAPSASPVVTHDRATRLTCGLLLVVAAACWVDVVAGMGSHASMAMEPMAGTLAEAGAYVVSWGVMMAAMMLPSALPIIALYGALQRKATGGASRGVPVALFALVYLLVWAGTGVPVYLASVLGQRIPADVAAYGVAGILLTAGAYQLSPLKQVCLRGCRSPLAFLLGHWRPGRAGSLALGWRHALYCTGCCWALMVVLVAAGAMGLPWVLLIAAVVAAEKLLPRGEWIARGVGGALVALAVAVALHPGLVMLLRHGHLM
jgi:predicted metal-binding membrane protein